MPDGLLPIQVLGRSRLQQFCGAADMINFLDCGVASPLKTENLKVRKVKSGGQMRFASTIT